MGVFVVNYQEGSAADLSYGEASANNVAIKYNAETNKWISAADIYWIDESTPADIYGYYPYDNRLTSTSAYKFEVSSDQSRVSSDDEPGGYEASDLLWAKSVAATPGEKVNLVYHHILSGVKVTLQPGAGFDAAEWSKASKSVAIKNTTRSASVNLSTGAVTADGDADRDVIMSPEADCWRGVVIPQSVAAGRELIAITIDGVSHNFTREPAMQFAPGKLHQFTIKVESGADAGDFTLRLVSEAITDWEVDNSSHDFEANSYVVVNVPTEGTLAESLVAANVDNETVVNLKLTGLLNHDDFRYIREHMPRLASLNLKETKMKNVVINEDWEDRIYDDLLPADALNNMTNLRRIVLPDGINRICSSALSGLRLTSALIIPESVKRLDAWALSGMGDEATIELPSSLERIDDFCFHSVKAAFELKLSNTIKHIGGGAFINASGARGTFAVPASIEYLGASAFNNMGKDLTGDIVIPTTLTEIPDNAFSSIHFANGTNLVLHEGITKIGGNAFVGLTFNNAFEFPSGLQSLGEAAFTYCRFVSSPKLPQNLKFLGKRVFLETNYSGEATYPDRIEVARSEFYQTEISSATLGDNIFQIHEGSFYRCEQLRRVTLGKNVEYIGKEAFARCHQLQTLICLAPEPPRIDGDSFNEVFKDKCVIEVPEGSVAAYRMADGWKEFQNITPHHELSFNISTISCLERGVTREGIVRAEGAWEVAECPSWVHVTPTSGEYRDEVTVKVDELSMTGGEREGEIVFRLKENDYTTYTTVRQQRCSESSEDTEIVLQSASAGGREIPVFIVGEGFTADDIVAGRYMQCMRETMEHFFGIEPYRSYRNYFTVSTAQACSPDREGQTVFDTRQNRFGTDGVSPDCNTLTDYAKRVSSHVAANYQNALIIMVVNTDTFCGYSNIMANGCSIAAMGNVTGVYPYDQRGLVQKYAGGEAFAGLGEESIAHFDHIKGCKCPECNALSKYNEMKRRGYYENLTMSSKMSESPWQDFIFNPKYSAIVDMYEGGYNHSRGVWRSETNSVMSTYIAYYNTISRYAIYKHIMRRAGVPASQEDFIANDKIELP